VVEKFVGDRQCNEKNNTDVGSLYVIMKVMHKKHNSPVPATQMVQCH
jgi:hypothetical protein